MGEFMTFEIAPAFFYMFISPVFIFFPHGKIDICLGRVSSISQSNGFGLRPFTYIICIAADIRRIEIDAVSFSWRLHNLLPIAGLELPIPSLHGDLHPINLVANFCYIRLGKALRLLAKWYVIHTIPIEAHNAVKTRPI